MSTAPNYQAATNINTAVAAGGGYSESTVDSQLVKAVANITAHTAVDSVESTAFAAALALLQAYQAHRNSPATKG